MTWLRQEALVIAGDERVGVDIGRMLSGGGLGGGGSEGIVDDAYISSLKQEVDSLVAQQRVGIAWTRFLRSVERRQRSHST